MRDARLKASEHHHYILRAGKFPADRVAVHSALSGTGRMPGPFDRPVRRSGQHGSAWLPAVATEQPVAVAKDFDAARDLALSQATSGPAQVAFLFSPMRSNPFLALDRSITIGSVQATPAVVPGVLCGVLKQPGRRQVFAVQLEKGQRIFVRAEAKALNSPADLELTITDRTGREQRRGQDKPDGSETSLDFTAQNPGTYGIAVRDILRDGGDSHAYRITVRSDPFPPVITAEVEGLTIPQKNYQIVPLTITRTESKGPIKLTLAGNATGLRLIPDTIGETETAVVCKLEADRRHAARASHGSDRRGVQRREVPRSHAPADRQAVSERGPHPDRAARRPDAPAGVADRPLRGADHAAIAVHVRADREDDHTTALPDRADPAHHHARRWLRRPDLVRRDRWPVGRQE